MNTELLETTLLMSASEAFALYSIRKYVDTNSTGELLAGVAGYALLAGFLLPRSIRLADDGLAVANGLWNAMSNITGLVIGVTLFSEKLTTKKLIGLILGTVSVYLLGEK